MWGPEVARTSFLGRDMVLTHAPKSLPATPPWPRGRSLAYAVAYAVTEEVEMTPVREARLFRNGRNQAIRVPREFELPGETALIYQDGARLVIEPQPNQTLAGLFERWDDLDEEFPVIEDEPMPLDEEVF